MKLRANLWNQVYLQFDLKTSILILIFANLESISLALSYIKNFQISQIK